MKLGFKDMKLVVTLGIGADEIDLAFGGSSGQTKQSSSGLTAQLTGILGTFNVAVDVQGLIGGRGISAFQTTGAFSLKIQSLTVTVPDVVTVTGGGIAVSYDPNYDPAKNQGKPQRLLTLDHASVTFPAFGVTGSINSTVDAGGQRTPGLVVWDNGFALASAELIYKPGGSSNLSQTGGSTGKISFGSLLEFDDLRIGVTELQRSRSAKPSHSTAPSSSPPAAPLSCPASRSRRRSATGCRPSRPIGPACPNTEAIRADARVRRTAGSRPSSLQRRHAQDHARLASSR